MRALAALRPATATDLDTVRSLLREAQLPVDGLDEQFGASYVLAQSGADVVGAMGIERYGDYGLLRSAVTVPGWRGKGLGQELTRERLGWARSQNLRAIYLLTTTAADFFARFGFQHVPRPEVPAEIRGSREFKSACPESAAVMVLSLDDPAR